MAILKDLIVKGPSRFIDVVNFNNYLYGDSSKFNNTIYADTIDTRFLTVRDHADIASASISELEARHVTVTGILDANEIHSNSWTSSNIANVGGNFYISPTQTLNSGIASINYNSNNTPAYYTLTIESEDHGINWSINSKVMITGSLIYNNVSYPLGTCTGIISGLSTNGITITNIYSANATIENSTAGALQTIYNIIGNSNATIETLTISEYEIGDTNGGVVTYYPIGILLTSHGINEKTYIDIYGGNQPKNESTGFAEPNVRIGELTGTGNLIKNIYDNNNQPINQTTIPITGWGIYTSNGYFKGSIVADNGYIGGFLIGDTALYNGRSSIDIKSNFDRGIFFGLDGLLLYDNPKQYALLQDGILQAQGASLSGVLRLEHEINTINALGEKVRTLENETIEYEDIKQLKELFSGSLDVIYTVSNPNCILDIDTDVFIERFSTLTYGPNELTGVNEYHYEKGKILEFDGAFIEVEFKYTNDRWEYNGNNDFIFLKNNGTSAQTITVTKGDEVNLKDHYGITLNTQENIGEGQEDILVYEPQENDIISLSFINTTGTLEALNTNLSNSSQLITSLEENLASLVIPEDISKDFNDFKDDIDDKFSTIIIDKSAPSITLVAGASVEEGASLILTNDQIQMLRIQNGIKTGLQMSSNKLSIYVENSKETTYFDNKSLYSPQIFSQVLRLRHYDENSNTWSGELAWIVRENGHLSLKLIS